jgi:hypothetical protein
MPNQSDSNNELTPEGAEVLQGILEETKTLREIDLGEAPPAAVFEAE